MILLCTVSCENQADVIDDIARLRKERDVISNEYHLESEKRDRVVKEIKDMEETLKELGIYYNGRTPKYIVRFELSQSFFNSNDCDVDDIEFEIPVERDFYQNVREGDNINDKFRHSYNLFEDFGDWDMRVIRKNMY